MAGFGASIFEKSTQFSNLVGKVSAWVLGPPSGPGSIVDFGGGLQVKSIARLCAAVDDAVQFGVAGPVPWATPVLWAPGLICVATPPATAVTYLGETYVTTTAHTAGGSFDAAKFVKVTTKGTDLGAARSVRDFGAKGDGLQDDAPYIQAALDSFAGKPAVLYVPPGTYKCMSQLTVSVSGAKSLHLIGAGLGAAALYWPSGGGLQIQFPVPDSTSMREQYAEVRDLSLLASATSAGIAIDVSCATAVGDNSPGFYMNNCYVGSDNQNVANYWTNAVKLTNIRNFGFSDCVFNGQVNTTSAAKHIYLTGGTVDGEIRNCGFFNAARGVDIDGDCEGVHLDNCAFVYTGTGVRWISTLPHVGTGLTIDGCHFSCLNYGVDASDVAHGAITNCRPFQKREGTGNSYVDINLAKGCYQWEIAGNHFRGAGSGGTADGIVIGVTGDGSWINIHDNVFEDRRYGVWPKASTSAIFVHDNVAQANVTTFIKNDMTAGNGGVFRDNRAASGLMSALELARTLANNSATPSVDGAQYGSFLANNSTTTTVTDLLHGQPGMVIDIMASNGNTTFAHNSKINLQGAANWAMGTGAILTLKYRADLGTWFEQCRRTP